MKFCDVTTEAVFSSDDDDVAGFDVVIASLVFDVVALNENDFRRYLSNVVNHLKPGSILSDEI